MKDSELISGTFVDRNAGDLDHMVQVSREDIGNYLAGRFGKLTSRKLRALRELERDPVGDKWDESHQHYIYIDPDDFFEFLFVNFPAEDSWEKSYQKLRRLVGPHPIDWANALTAIHNND